MIAPFRIALLAAAVAFGPATVALAQQSAPPAPRPYAPPPASPYTTQSPYQSYATAPARLDRDIARALPNGCRYVATVRGVLAPLAAGYGQVGSQVQPNVSVGAQVTCPYGASNNLSENLIGGAPMTLTDLEDSLDRRGTVFLESYGRRCAFMPEFTVSPKGGVDLVNVLTVCGRAVHAATAPQPVPPPAQRVR